MCVIYQFELGCSVDIEWRGHGNSNQPYVDVINNPVLADVYKKHAESFGVKYLPRALEKNLAAGSTDMGNISHAVPSIHPVYSIATTAGNHTHEFTAATGSEIAQPPTLRAAKCMAMTTLEVLCNPELLERVKSSHNEHKR